MLSNSQQADFITRGIQTMSAVLNKQSVSAQTTPADSDNTVTERDAMAIFLNAQPGAS